MSIDYPNTPTVGQKFTSGGFQWTWDGGKWNGGSGAGGQVFSVAGRTGDVILTHNDITDWATAAAFLPLAGGTISGAISVTGNITSSNEIISTLGGGNYGGLRLVGGNYGAMLRQDGGSLYVLLTNSGNQYGSWNGLRPLIVNLANGLVTCGNNITITNQTWYQGNDTNGNPANLLTMWSDNNCYLSETSRPLHCRGSTISMEGTTTFQNDVTINIGHLNVYGGTFYNGYNDGWLYFNGSMRVWDFQSQNNLNAAGSVIINGLTWQNSGGWMYTPNSVQTNGNLQANGGVLYLAGMYWQNYGGYMYCPWSIHTDNVVNIAGVVVQNNAGWLYSGSPINSGSDIAANGVLRAGGTGGVYWQDNAGWMFTGNSFWANDVITCASHCYPRNQGGCYSGLGSNSWAACYSYAYPGPSGRDMKTDIADAPPGALAHVTALRVVNYRWREEVRPISDDEHRVHRGFIADEAATVLGRDFGGYYDAAGNERLDKTEMVCVLWQAVQELAAEVAALRKVRVE
jgi:hypothetical protein